MYFKLEISKILVSKENKIISGSKKMRDLSREELYLYSDISEQ